MDTENPQPVDDDTESESTKTSLNAPDDTAAMSLAETRPVGSSSDTRKLRRLAPTSGQSRYAKLSAERRRRKSIGSIGKPEDLISVCLADGRYKVVGRFGKGSMAYVLRATDRRLKTDVVVKIPKPEKLAGDEIRERFRRESQLLVRLAHPHVVKVLDVGEYHSVPYVVMQLLSGGTLADRMDRSGKDRQMAPESIREWLQQVSRALDFCAKQGTVHRDVKPANILFDDDGNPYVADFGLTKIMYGEHMSLNSSETTAGVVLGTPNYIAPEIVLGNHFDGRADQYSLGITLYHTLFGRAPMQGNSATLTMINQTQKQLQLLSDIRSDIPRKLALAIRKSIEKDPAKRFANCEEFAAAALEGLTASSAASIKVTDPNTATQIANSDTRKAHTGSAKRNRTRSSRSVNKNRSAATSKTNAFYEGRSNGDDRLTVASGPLPPKRRVNSNSKKNKKGKSPSGIVIFGKTVHPAMFIGGGITAALALLLSITLFSNDGQNISNSSVVDFQSEENPPTSDDQKHDMVDSGNQRQPRSDGLEYARDEKRQTAIQPTKDVIPKTVEPSTNVAEKSVAQPISFSKEVD